MNQSEPQKKSVRKRKTAAPLVIGWREVVSLPDLGLSDFRAKIDTGARTSALHALRIEPLEREGHPWVRFAPPDLGHGAPAWVEAPLIERRAIKNTSGVPEDRYVIRTHLQLASRRFLIEVALANRGDMAFPMIIGRTAIRGHGLLVDCGRSWLTRRKSALRRSIEPTDAQPHPTDERPQERP